MMWKWIHIALAVILTAAVVAALTTLWVVYSTRAYIYSSVDATPTAQAALVLGASVTAEGQLSLILKERADEAVALYQAGKVSKILVTGDNSTVEHNEVDPTGRYLVSQGVAPQDIFLDHAGFDTYSSMYRAKEVFGVTSVIIVSQAFHLPRAVYLARKLGLDAVGVEAPNAGVTIYNYAREVPADVKAVWDVFVRRVPEYLGEEYPISGNGEDTWGYSLASSTAATSTVQ